MLNAGDDEVDLIVEVSDSNDHGTDYDGLQFDDVHSGDFNFNESDQFADGVTVVDINAPQRRKKERRRTTALINAINTQPVPGTTFAADAEALPDLEEDEITEFIRTAVSAADKRKGEDILALRVSTLTCITSFIVFVTGRNTPQLRAISNIIEEDLAKKHELEPRRIDGVPASGWILLDCKLVTNSH